MNAIQTLLNRFVGENMASGVSALVFKGGREAFFGYAGSLVKDGTVPFARDTVLRMFSMTKVVTAAAVMSLMDQGLLTPQTPVYEFIPEYKELRVAMPDGALVPANKPLTLHHLLTMTSGIPYPSAAPGAEDRVSPYYLKAMAQSGPDMTTLEMARAIARCPLCFQPGEGWLYGLSADVLGGVVAAVTGMELGQYLQKTFFGPLGMRDTAFTVPKDRQGRLAALYDVSREGLFTPRRAMFGFGSLENAKVEMGGAGLYSTVEDFARFGEMLRLGGLGILSLAAVRLMTQNQLTPGQLSAFSGVDSGYGYGYLVRTLMDESKNAAYRERLGAFGWNGMAGTTLRVDPKREMTVVFGVQRVPAEHPQFLPPLMRAVADTFD